MAHVVCSVCGVKGGGLLGASKWFYRMLGGVAASGTVVTLAAPT